MVNHIRSHQDPHGRSALGLMAPVFAEDRLVSEATASG
jgi:hypothetical protein